MDRYQLTSDPFPNDKRRKADSIASKQHFIFTIRGHFDIDCALRFSLDALSGATNASSVSDVPLDTGY